MGSHHSKNAATLKAKQPNGLGEQTSTPQRSTKATIGAHTKNATNNHENKRETTDALPKQQTQQPKLVPSEVKRFRVGVPPSMVPGDIMTIKLNGMLTKILITAPTSPKDDKKAKDTATSTEQQQEAGGTSCSGTGSTPALSPTTSADSIDNTADHDTVIASTDAEVPEGKMIVGAKPVIVVHMVFSQTDSSLQDQMIDETMKEVIQETLNSGCNSILGMTVSVKERKDHSGFLIKACGTPCVLMPAQVLLAPPSSSGVPNFSSSDVLPTPIRKRTLSTELPPPRRQ